MKALEGNLDCIQKYIVTEISLSIDALMYFKYETVTTFLKKGMAQSSHPFLVSVAWIMLMYCQVMDFLFV